MDMIVEARSRPKINIRLIVFLTPIALIFGWMTYMLVSQSLTGGISRSGDLSRVDLKALGNFEFDDRSGTINDVPPKYRALDGKRVELQGFMYARTSAAPRLDHFEFVYNVTLCCFGVSPRVQERVYVYVPEGHTLPYVSSYIRLTGILHVKVEKPEGVTTSVYTLDVEKAEPIT